MTLPDELERITLNGHMYVHVAACPCQPENHSITSVVGHGDGTMSAWLDDGRVVRITEDEYAKWPGRLTT